MADERDVGSLVDSFLKVIPDAAGAIMFATRAGLSTARITANARPIDVWTELVSEAIRLDNIDKLLAQGKKEFP